MEILSPTPANIRRAAEMLVAGEVIAYPTETVYGLGVDPFNEAALARLYAVKKRDERNPVLLIIGGMDQLALITRELTPKAEAYAKAFWPGPLSLVLPGEADLPQSLRGPDGKICVRWTSHPIASELCTLFSDCIVSTSANLSGQPPARSAAEVPSSGVSVCIDGGILGTGPASTVFDPETEEVLREGAISKEVLARVRR